MKSISNKYFPLMELALALIFVAVILNVFVYDSRSGIKTEIGERVGTPDMEEAPVYPQIIFNQRKPDPQTDLKKQRQTINDLSRQINLLEQKIEALPDTHEELLDDKADDAEANESEDLQYYENQTALLENTVETEPVDGEWAVIAENEIEERVYSVKDSTVAINDLDCRSTLCRVDLVFDPSIHEETFDRIHDYLPWNSEIFFKIEDVTTGEAVVYVARQDHDLPKYAY